MAGYTGIRTNNTHPLADARPVAGRRLPRPRRRAYTFDTAQIMRGLCAAVGDVVVAQDALRRASDWMLTQVDPSGRLLTPSTELWADIATPAAARPCRMLRGSRDGCANVWG